MKNNCLGIEKDDIVRRYGILDNSGYSDRTLIVNIIIENLQNEYKIQYSVLYDIVFFVRTIINECIDSEDKTKEIK